MKMVVIPHGAKVTGITQYPPELASDPPMTMNGKAKMLELVPALKNLGPYKAVYCSLMDRAAGSMCTLAKQLGIKRAVCIDELGQYSNKDDDGTSIRYPGHETDNVITWQKQGLDAMRLIYQELFPGGESGGGALGGGTHVDHEIVVLVFTHRPILAGLIATASYITDAEGIEGILAAKDLTGGKGFRVFNYDGRLTLEV